MIETSVYVVGRNEACRSFEDEDSCIGDSVFAVEMEEYTRLLGDNEVFVKGDSVVVV